MDVAAEENGYCGMLSGLSTGTDSMVSTGTVLDIHSNKLPYVAHIEGAAKPLRDYNARYNASLVKARNAWKDKVSPFVPDRTFSYCTTDEEGNITDEEEYEDMPGLENSDDENGKCTERVLLSVRKIPSKHSALKESARSYLVGSIIFASRRMSKQSE